MLYAWGVYACAVLAPVTLAFPTFPALVPNGLYVPCPSHFDETESAEQCARDICKGLGHVDCRGGDYPNPQGEFLNAFGKAFRDAGRQWTTELCNEDSDGDGKTNGEELGDPCCVWQPAALPTTAADYRISHPGHAQDTTDSPGPTPAECQALKDSQGAAAAFDEEEWIDSLYNRGEDRLNITFKVQEHTILPNETMYTRVYFPIPQDKDYYIVGFLADIVNKVNVHHFVVYLCTVGIDSLYDPPREAGFPEQPTNGTDMGDIPEECQQNLYVWVPGGDQFPLPNNMALKYGKSTPYKAVFLEIHYNNPEGATDATDSSGFTALVTSTPRQHEATWWWTGSIINTGDIPPGKEAYFNAAECTVNLLPDCDAIHAFANTPHAHFIGDAVWSEHWRPNKYGQLTYVGDIGREDAYNYELQYSRLFEEEITIKDGDVVSGNCVYNSMDRTEATPGGLASREEMCVNFLLIYPASCVSMPWCFGAGRIVSGEAPSTATAPFTAPDLYPVGGAPNFTALAEDGLTTCTSDTVYNNSLFGPTGNPAERVLAAFSESCPGIFGEESELMTPEGSLQYECSAACIDWLINFGTCAATDLKEKLEELGLLQGLSSVFGNPLALTPPTCHVGMVQKLTEQSGGTYSPATANTASSDSVSADADATVASDAGGYPTSSAAFLSAVSLLNMLLMVTTM